MEGAAATVEAAGAEVAAGVGVSLMPEGGNEGHNNVCGLGHVGYRVALLLRGLDVAVSVVYDHAPDEWLRQVRDAGVECFSGDARDDRVLEQAGIRHARAVIAATDQDLVNLSVALDARRRTRA